MGGGDDISRSAPIAIPSGDAAGPSHGSGLAVMIQSLLDAVPGEIVWSTPIRNAAGEIVDFVTLAAGSEARDLHGRIGKELIGVRMLDATRPSVEAPSGRARCA